MGAKLEFYSYFDLLCKDYYRENIWLSFCVETLIILDFSVGVYQGFTCTEYGCDAVIPLLVSNATQAQPV